MTATVTIQNADKSLVDALKSLVKLSPAARIKVRRTREDDFFSDGNMRHLAELKRLDDEGRLKFTAHDLAEA